MNFCDSTVRKTINNKDYFFMFMRLYNYDKENVFIRINCRDFFFHKEFNINDLGKTVQRLHFMFYKSEHYEFIYDCLFNFYDQFYFREHLKTIKQITKQLKTRSPTRSRHQIMNICI
jgi:hypothetical protein